MASKLSWSYPVIYIFRVPKKIITFTTTFDSRKEKFGKKGERFWHGNVVLFTNHAFINQHLFPFLGKTCLKFDFPQDWIICQNIRKQGGVVFRAKDGFVEKNQWHEILIWSPAWVSRSRPSSTPRTFIRAKRKDTSKFIFYKKTPFACNLNKFSINCWQTT